MTGETTALNAASTKAKVFISYSRKDMVFADRLEAALKAREFEPLIDRTEIYAFEEWWKRIEALIAQADTVVFVLSPDSVASEVALKEVAFAASLNKRFAPVMCRHVDDKEVPETLAKLNFIFFDDAPQFDESVKRLAEALSTDIGWIRMHTEVGEAARRWAAANRPGGLLLRSPLLEEAERWIAARPANAPAPTEDTQAFIRQSRQGATRRRNVLTGSLAAGLVLALSLAGLAYWQRGVAVEQERIAVDQRGIAERNEARAKVERDNAERNFKLAQKTAESLVFDIAQGLRNVQGMRAETVRKILETARATFEQLATSAPDDRTLQRSRAMMLDSFGDTYVTLGELQQALKTYRDGLAVMERLVAADPDNALWQNDLFRAYISLVDALVAQRDINEALKASRSAVAIAEHWAAPDKANARRWHSSLATAYEKLGDVLSRQNNLAGALKAYRDSLAIRNDLVGNDPSNMRLQRALLVSHRRIASTLHEQGQLPEALQAYRESLAIAKRIASADQSNTQAQRDLLISYSLIGDLLKAQDEFDEALKTYRDGLAIAERLVSADPGNVNWQRDVSMLYQDIGTVFMERSNFDEALKAHLTSLKIFETLAATDGSHVIWQRDLSVSYEMVGDVLMAQGKLEETLRFYRASLAIRERLAAADRSNTLWQGDLQTSIDKIGRMAYNFVLARNFAMAVAAAEQAISLAPEKIWLYTNHAHALMFLDRVEEARALYLKYRGTQKVEDEKSWETVILGDLAEMRKEGLTHPLMDEIEKRFAAGG